MRYIRWQFNRVAVLINRAWHTKHLASLYNASSNVATTQQKKATSSDIILLPFLNPGLSVLLLQLFEAMAGAFAVTVVKKTRLQSTCTLNMASISNHKKVWNVPSADIYPIARINSSHTSVALILTSTQNLGSLREHLKCHRPPPSTRLNIPSQVIVTVLTTWSSNLRTPLGFWLRLI